MPRWLRPIFRQPLFRGLRGGFTGVFLLAMLFATGGGHASESLLRRPAPDFTRRTLDGTPIQLDDFRGKVVLLNFWATWCEPCRVEMPRFAEWQRQFGPDGFQVLAVSMDDDISPVRTFVQRMRPNFPVIMGDARLGELYGGVMGVPVTFLIDRNGIVRDRYDGGPLTPNLGYEIRRLLDAGSTRSRTAVALKRNLPCTSGETNADPSSLRSSG